MNKEHLVRFHQQNILAAAEKLFSEKGVCQTTMDDISRAAEYSKSTIYVYFHSKDEIYNYIIPVSYTHLPCFCNSMDSPCR